MKWLPDLLVRSELPPIHRYLVCVIAVHRGLDGRWWNPTQTQLAELTGLSQPCVSKALRHLQATQWIIRSEVSSGGIETPCLRLHPRRTPQEAEKPVETAAAPSREPALTRQPRRDRIDPPPSYLMPFEALPQDQQQGILAAAARHERGESPVGLQQIADLRSAFWYGKASRKVAK